MTLKNPTSEQRSEVPGDPSPTRHFEICPNPPERGWILCGFFLACAAVSLGVSGYLHIFKGLRFALPFSGLELIGLGTALWLTWHRAQRRELVAVNDTQVTVERIPSADAAHRCCWRSPRPWTRVVLQAPAHTGHLPRVLLRHRECELELGSCLGEAERRSLAQTLAHAVSLGGRP